jgi:hypothetical protein
MQGKFDALIDRLVTVALMLPPIGRDKPEVPPPEGGEDEIERGLPEKYEGIGNRLRDEVVIPAVRSRPFGRVSSMPTAKLIPYYKYAPRHELLGVMSNGFGACRRAYRQTEYFHDQQERHGSWLATFKVARYYRLLKSVRQEGLKFDLATRRNLPVVFCAKDIVFRLDGTHRCSVARFLGHERLPIVAVLPEDVLALPDIPDAIRSFVESLAPPDEA